MNVQPVGAVDEDTIRFGELGQSVGFLLRIAQLQSFDLFFQRLASQGVGVLMISQDLDEIFRLSHCVAVISQGTLSEATAITDVTPEDIGLLMGERHTEEPEDRRAST